MKTAVYNLEGKESGEALLPKELFEVKMNPDLAHQVVMISIGNKREVIADTKNRGEVSGGGKKPWRQKGTGRARQGSTRSPLWRHGGIVFGPTNERNFKKEIPDRMRKAALFMALSDKAKNNLIIVLDDLKLETPKTKVMAEILGKLPSRDEKTLIVLPKMDKNLILAARNIKNVKTIQAKDLNALDLFSFRYLIILKESIKVIKETFLKK
ncbi:MAG: 50S ribosomal protein L4 [Candidatus Pacebacteria bacterium]|nr:50S ribosomal protein L4 [Candidatus Paceibacterota bacterium]